MCAMPSATSFSREIQSPTSNPQGFSLTAYRFQPSCTYVSATPTTGTSATSWPVVGQSFLAGGGPIQDPAFASMVNNYQDVRTVACSVRVQCTLPALTAQGFVHMAVVPEDLAGSTTWQYPTTLAGMERAPFYQKLPLANLINNTPTIALPIMDEGAWRYRNVNLVPTQVGQSFLQANTSSTTPVQVNYVGSTVSGSAGVFSVTFSSPFINAPTVVASPASGSTANIYSIDIQSITATGFSGVVEYNNGTTNGTFNGLQFGYEATGSMTPANASAVYASNGQATPAQLTSFNSVQIPGIETSYGWGAVIIGLENVGTTALNPIEVEIIRHYEAIPNDLVGNIITGTKAAPNCPEVLTLNKAVQDECGSISVLPDSGLDGATDGGFVANFKKCASWVAGVTGAVGSYHPALSVVSAVASSMAGVR